MSFHTHMNQDLNKKIKKKKKNLHKIILCHDHTCSGHIHVFWRNNLNNLFFITFDERVTDTVLGMDILQQVIFTANPYNRKMCFCKDAADYDQNFQLDVV